MPKFPHVFFSFAALLVVLLGHGICFAQPPGERGSRRRGGMDRMIQRSPVFKCLDVDGNGTISKEELANAYKAILTLDKNQDGNIVKDELMPPRPKNEGRGFRRGPGGMMRMDPLIAALDKDGDSELFDDEVTEAVRSLAKRDKNGDGALTIDELRPEFGRRGGPGFGRGRRRRGEDGEAIKTPDPSDLKLKDGTDKILTRAQFKEISYQGDDVLIDTHLKGLEYVKYTITGAGTDHAKLYFMNTKNHRAHPMFMAQFGIPRNAEGIMRGVIIYWPMLKSPSGESGLYTFEYEPNDSFSFEMVKVSFDLLVKYGPIMKGKLSYNLLPRSKEKYLTEPGKYQAAHLPTFEVKDRYADVAFLPLNYGEAFGRLKVVGKNERPDQRSIVIYQTLPNEMPRVAGVMTAVRQTPLSHVNLRAIQDNAPNAFIGNLLNNKKIKGLIGKYVNFKVTADGYEIREATGKEVEDHFAKLRPPKMQFPPRDLSVKKIRSLDDINFTDGNNVGVKAANLAALRKLGFRKDLTPQGFAVPFYFYDEFMKLNGFYKMAQAMASTKDFQSHAGTREKSLKKFRSAIKKGKMSPWMMNALSDVQNAFPQGTSIRARSSTNNEDLPGFSGAGLYDSYTHHPHEGHLSKSIKQVFASLWNFRAFEEREFYRIDHGTTAMGVVLHPNTTDEKANGVAVTRDILYQTEIQVGQRFFVNAQVGEDLITNPEADATPEELLLSLRNPRTDRVIRRSSLTENGKPVLEAGQLEELRRALRVIHGAFMKLYKTPIGERFAMEVEFKILKNGALFIKQARPWVYAQG